MKVAIYTLGCKVNQYETQAMEQELLARGHTLTEFSDEADAYIVNTCSGSQRPEVPAGDPRRPAEAPRRRGGGVRLLSPDPRGRRAEAGGGPDLRHRRPDGFYPPSGGGRGGEAADRGHRPAF